MFGARHSRGVAVPIAPAVVSYANYSTASNLTSHPVSLPPLLTAGNLLVLLTTNDGSATVTQPSGWALNTSFSNNGASRLAVMTRTVNGTEGSTATVTLSAAEYLSAVCLEISNADTVNVAAATRTYASTFTPPSLTPTVPGKNYLYIEGVSCDSARYITSPSTNYSNVYTSPDPGGTVACVSTARRVSGDSPETPGSFTINVSTAPAVFLMAVYSS